MMSIIGSNAAQRFFNDPFKRPEVPNRLPGATTQEATVNLNGDRVRVSASALFDSVNNTFSGLGRAEGQTGNAYTWLYGSADRFLIGGQETGNNGTQASFLQAYGERTPNGSVLTQEMGVAQRQGNTESTALQVGQLEVNNDGSTTGTDALHTRVRQGDNRLETTEASTTSFNNRGEITSQSANGRLDAEVGKERMTAEFSGHRDATIDTTQARVRVSDSQNSLEQSEHQATHFNEEGQVTRQTMNNRLDVSLNNGERRIRGSFDGVNDVAAGVSETRATYHDNGQALTADTDAHGYEISTRTDSTTGTTRTRFTDREGDEMTYQVDIRGRSGTGVTWDVRNGTLTYHGNLARVMGTDQPAESAPATPSTPTETPTPTETVPTETLVASSSAQASTTATGSTPEPQWLEMADAGYEGPPQV